MASYIFDCETNGLLPEVSVIHSLVLKDIDTFEVISCADHPGYKPISHGLKLLAEADMIIGHNVIKYDIPVLDKVRGLKPQGTVRDTLVLSRLIWSEMKESDFAMHRKREREGRKWIPGNLYGKHSLESWGHRLGHYKGDFGKVTHDTKAGDVWAKWSKEMQDYCEQDVEVTFTLWKRIIEKNYSPAAIELEHAFCTIIGMQERHGFHFDVAKAQSLYATLVQRRLELETQLRSVFKPWWQKVIKKGDKGIQVPKRTITYSDPMRPSYVEGAAFTRVEYVTFNPSSHAHIILKLKEMYGWEPTEFTERNQPKLDDEVMSKLPYPEAPILSEYLMVQKRIGQLAEGDKAWLRYERDGRIHGEVITNGAVTGRCTHMRPNVAQTPAVGVPYGKECRELWYAPKGYKQVGADASGLELRCLAHFMSKYDGGIYAKLLLEGDIHWANVQAMGLCSGTRDKHSKLHDVLRGGAKTFIYGFLYGAGDEKAGRIVYDIIVQLKALGLPYANLVSTFFGGKEDPDAEDLKKAGKKLKTKFLKATPAIRELREAVKVKVEKTGKLNGLDGRQLHIRSSHAALNTLLQSAGALAVKQATVFLYLDLTARGMVFGRDYALVAHIHDEMQLIVKEGLEDEVGKAAVAAIQRAGEHFGFRVTLDGEFKVGQNWAETH